MALHSKMNKVLSFNFLRPLFIVLLCFFIGIQATWNDEIANLIIFKTASLRFLHRENLYEFIQYKIIYDKFFYAPQFVLFFMPFVFLPVKAAVFVWVLTGGVLYYWALKRLPFTHQQKQIIFLIALIDLINSLQNLQTNAINTALMLLIFGLLQQGKVIWAALCVAFCLSIKIYPAAAALLFVFYPDKIKFLGYCVLFTLLFFMMPLFFVSKAYFVSCLSNWFHSISEDAQDKSIANSPSLIGINYTWFSRPLNPIYIQLVGLAIVVLPLLKILKKEVNSRFQALYLSFIMLFVVIFNHAAESPTYVIAVTGAAIWYALSAKQSVDNILLFLLMMACILTPTDLFPAELRKNYLAPLKIRVIPCLLIWLKIFYELVTYKPLASDAV